MIRHRALAEHFLTCFFSDAHGSPYNLKRNLKFTQILKNKTNLILSYLEKLMYVL